jgi:hypothetical protein
MSKYYSIKKGGFPAQPELIEAKDSFITHQPPEYLDSDRAMADFVRIYGFDLAAECKKARRAPENVEEKWVLPGIHYTVGEDPKPASGIPEVGEPAYVARIEKKLDALLAAGGIKV